MSIPTPQYERFTGHKHLRNRIVLSTQFGRPILISQIRSSSSTNPGLAPHEVSFLRLIESITNGSALEFSYTGTKLIYHPGLITGSANGLGAIGDVIECVLPETNTRGVSWFLLPLCQLAPFSKAPVNVRFTGPGVITAATENGDMSVDSFLRGVLPLYEPFGIWTARTEIRIIRRSCAGSGGRGGGGEVELRFGSQVRLPKTLHWNRSPGRVKKITGVAFSTGVGASLSRDEITAARGVLNPLCPNISIASIYDPAPLVPERSDPTGKKKRKTGVGFGIFLIAETSAGVLYTADVVSPSTGGVTAEDLGRQAAFQLLENIEVGGCVSSAGVSTVLMLMAMGSEDVGRIRLSRDVIGSEDIIQLARDLKKFGASSWATRDVNDDDGTTDVIISVKGTGLGNVGKAIK